MKKLGEGWQYTVYDLENGRVLKTYNSSLRTVWIILKDIIPYELKGLRKIPDYVPDLRRKARRSFEILKQKNLPPAWFANPTFLDDLNYGQDKITPLHDIFATRSIEDSKKIIDQFIAFNRTLMSHGIIDKFFNISRNFGHNKHGDMVLADLGEIEDNVQKILRLRTARIWAEPYKLKWICHQDLRTYFVEQMDVFFGVVTD